MREPEFIVDGLTVDEVDEYESGQEEAYESFQHAADEARREEARQAAEDDRKERRVIAELTATAILWAVFTLASLVMWTVMTFRTDSAIPRIGYASAWAGTLVIVKPIVALVEVCMERIKERRGRKEDP